MRKFVFFAPAVCFSLLYGGLAFLGLGAIRPWVAFLLLCLWVAGLLLAKKQVWGGIIGGVPAVSFIWMGLQDNGQIIREWPLGLVLLLYFAACSWWICRKA